MKRRLDDHVSRRRHNVSILRREVSCNVQAAHWDNQRLPMADRAGICGGTWKIRELKLGVLRKMLNILGVGAIDKKDCVNIPMSDRFDRVIDRHGDKILAELLLV